MFALCGVMIVVGIAYIGVAPDPAPSEAVVTAAAPRAEVVAAATPVSVASSPARVRAVSRDAVAGGASDQATVPSLAPSVIVTSPPTTTADITVPIASPSTVMPPPTAVAVTTTTLATTTTILSITLTGSPPLIVAGSAPLSAPPPAAAPTAKVYGHTDSGIASWFNAPDNTCAHRTLPFGTTVKVVRPGNGAVAFCKVDDRGPTLETGRLIDLSMDTFSKLASPGTGLIDVTIEW